MRGEKLEWEVFPILIFIPIADALVLFVAFVFEFEDEDESQPRRGAAILDGD